MDGITERIERAQRGDKGERDRLVVDNMPLVWSMVGRFSSSGKDKEELFQIGMIGLMQAIDRFDTTYDVRFSTYAVPLILGEIRRFLRDDNPIKVSRTIAEHRKQIQTLQQGQEDISVDQIVEKTGLTREDVVLAMASADRSPPSMRLPMIRGKVRCFWWTSWRERKSRWRRKSWKNRSLPWPCRHYPRRKKI